MELPDIELYWIVTLQWTTDRGTSTSTRSGGATFPGHVTRQFAASEVLATAATNCGAPKDAVVLFLSIERDDFGS